MTENSKEGINLAERAENCKQGDNENTDLGPISRR